MMEHLQDILFESWAVLGQMAPYLLLGFLIAGILSAFLSPETIEKHLAGKGWGPVAKASFFGVPLPLCSCGVIPVAVSMRKHGASRASVTSFLLSTPQTGVDSIAVTYALLGPILAIFRPIAALITGLLGGGLVQALAEHSDAPPETDKTHSPCEDSCCEDKQTGSRLHHILRYSFVTLPRDVAGALLLGVVLAGILSASINQNQFEAYLGEGIGSILIMMLIGAPLYVCATASVPMAAGFMFAGASPGAALAFLIAGPATNAATFTVIWKALGHRSAIIYLGAVAASAIGFGLALDAILPAITEAIPAFTKQAHHAAEGGWWYHLSAIVLLLVLAISQLEESSKKRRLSQQTSTQTVRFAVTGMTCEHCASSVRKALSACTGVLSVKIDVKEGAVTIEGNEAKAEDLIAAIKHLGFEATVVFETTTKEMNQ